MCTPCHAFVEVVFFIWGLQGVRVLGVPGKKMQFLQIGAHLVVQQTSWSKQDGDCSNTVMVQLLK